MGSTLPLLRRVEHPFARVVESVILVPIRVVSMLTDPTAKAALH